MKKTALRIFFLIGIVGGIFSADVQQAFSKETVLLDTCCGSAATENSGCCASKHASCPKFIPAARPTLAILTTKTVPVFDQVVVGFIALPQSDQIVSTDEIDLTHSLFLTEHYFEVSPPLRAPPASAFLVA